VLPNVLPLGLPPFREIEHQIDLLSGTPLLNKWLIGVTLIGQRSYSNKSKSCLILGTLGSLSHYSVATLFVPKKDGTWCMCVDSKAINNIIINYRFPIA